MTSPTTATESAVMQKVRALDAAGRFAESYEALSVASQQHDLAAMTELGHRLLVGDRAPKSARHALPMLVEAGQGGDGRALARLASLTAAGAYVKQDWQQAMALLAQAATAGDTAAQGQLLCLQPPDGTYADWPGIASQVPLNFWLNAAPRQTLHDKVYRMPAMVPPKVCEWLIRRAQGRLQPALVYDSVSHENQVHEMRTNTMALFDWSTFDVVQFLVQSRMSRTCGYPMQHFEAPMILRYEVGQQITPHFDFIDAQAADYAQQIREQGQRMITFLLYLNNDYEGGETTFPELGIVHRGSTGDGLYFINAHQDLSPDRSMLHTGSPPTAGEKWIITQFIVSRQLRP